MTILQKMFRNEELSELPICKDIYLLSAKCPRFNNAVPLRVFGVITYMLPPS